MEWILIVVVLAVWPGVPLVWGFLTNWESEEADVKFFRPGSS